MKSYRIFIIILVLLLGFYIYAEVTTPKPVSWEISLQNTEKSPYGAYILYHSLGDYFPKASIHSYRKPVYTVLTEDSNLGQTPTAYFLIAPYLRLQKEDVQELLAFTKKGNYVFVSAERLSDVLKDSLDINLNHDYSVTSKDVSVNFTNPKIKKDSGYTFPKNFIGYSFKSLPAARSTQVLGMRQPGSKPNFIQINHGKGAFFVHSSPICFSNLFYLTKNNASYADAALSFVPEHTKTIVWDEYYKQGREEAGTPLRILLSFFWTRWALRVGMALIILYVLFGIKRKQRIIPIQKPLQNTSLLFAKTISGLYFEKKENDLIMEKKILYFRDFIKRKYNVILQDDESTIIALSAKSRLDIAFVAQTIREMKYFTSKKEVTDNELISFHKRLESFYKNTNN